MSRYRAALIAAFLAVFASSYLGPITEGDFFWHLRRGQEIWGAGGLPKDYFMSQWLGQLLLYMFFKLSGFAGIVILRASVYTLILAFLFNWMRRENVPFYSSLLFVMLPAHLFISFPSERPQLFSFLLFPVAIYLLETFRKGAVPASGTDSGEGGGRSGMYTMLVLPVMLVVWANIHAGFMLAMAACGIYAFSEFIGIMRGRGSIVRLAAISAVTLSPAVVLLLRPGSLTSTVGLAMGVLFPGAYAKSIMEYLSPVTAAMELKEYFPAFWIFLLVSMGVVLRTARRMPLAHVLLLVAVGGLSLHSLRFMPFFLMLAPLAASGLSSTDQSSGQSRMLAVGFAAILALWVVLVPRQIELGVSPEFPVYSARFLGKLKPGTKVFNYQGWAGYLYWSDPELEFFVPVENVSADIDAAYERMIWAESTIKYGTTPQWRALMDAYGMEAVIMPGMSPSSGVIYPLMDRLVTDREWSLVYSDKVASIFLRKTADNAELIRIYSMSKEMAYLQIIAQASRYLDQEPARAEVLASQYEADAKYRAVKAGRPLPAK